MKNNFKFLIVLTILLAGCICIGSTFAADSNIDVTDVSSVDNTQNIQIAHDDSSNDIVPNPAATVGTFDELNNTISGKTGIINLTKDYTYNSTTDSSLSEGITISSSDVVIDGHGCTIDGSSLARAFKITGNNVTIKNIKFINTVSPDGFFSDGGAICWSGANGTVSNCNFTNTNASEGGGAISWSGANGTVSGCNFANCNASIDGGAISWSLNCPNGVVSGCNFANCNASTGGAISWQGKFGVVSGCNFINTTALNGGGAIYWSGANGTVSGCNFINTTALNGYGGAIVWFNANGTVSGCNFTDCNASRSGGAIFWEDVNGVVSGCNFINTTASVSGNAIYILSDRIDDKFGELNITGCSYNSTDDKAPIYNDGGIILSNVVITTMNGETKKVTKGDNITLTATVTTNGMRIAGKGLTFTINGINVTAKCDNTGLYYSKNNYTVDFAGTKLVNATYNYSTEELQSRILGKLTTEKLDGTGSFTDLNATVSNQTGIIDIYNNYTYNSTTDSSLSGGITISSSNVVIDGHGCTIDGSGLARAFNITGNNVTIKNINFINTNATDGGAIYWRGANGTVSGCNFTNTNALVGGAISWQGKFGVVSGCIFTNTNASTGGAINWYDSGYGSVEDCSFVNCSAGAGGAISWEGANGVVSGCNFTNTNATDGGGAIHWSNGANGVVSGCIFTNTNASSGGAIDWYGAFGVVSGCNFTDCSASYGGAIRWVYGTNGTVSDCNFINTNASTGGAISWEYSIDNCYGTVSGCNFINTNATDGGAIYWDADYGTVSGCNFINCSASVNGGAISWQGYDSVVSGCNFTNTNASNGGAIFGNDYAVNYVVSGCIFTNTIASKGNAICMYDLDSEDDDSPSLNITNCIYNSTDDNAPIYTNGTILSDVVITTMDGKTKNVAYGELVNLTGIVTTSGMRVAGGVLTLSVNGSSFNASSDDAGVYSHEYLVDFMGSKSVTANYLNTTGSQTLNAYNITTSSIIDIDVFDVAGVYGDNITGSINTTCNGTITFTIDDAKFTGRVIDGAFVISNVTGLNAGNYADVPVSFVSDNGSYIGNTNVSFTLSPKSVDVSVNSLDCAYGAGIRGTMDFTGYDGNVTITIDGIVYNGTFDSTGNFIISDVLPVKEYVGTFSFITNDGNYIGSAPVSFNVTNANGSFKVNVKDIVYGSGFTINVTDAIGVNDEHLNGIVVVMINGKEYNVTLTNGAGSKVVNDILPVDEYTVSASLTVPNYNVITNTTKFNVTNANCNFVVTVENAPYGSGFTVNVTATGVLNEGLNGTVRFVVNNKSYEFNIVDGVGSKHFDTVLPINTYGLVANFTASNYNVAKNGTSFKVTNATGSFNVIVEDSVYGSGFTINVTDAIGVNDEHLNGIVVVMINGKEYNVTVVNGIGSKVVDTILPVGEYSVSASLTVPNYDVITDTTKFNVTNADCSFEISVEPITYGDNFTINVTDAIGVLGEALNGTAIVVINSNEYNVTVINGSGSKVVDTILPAGNYDVSATFVADNYNVAENSASLTVIPKTMDISVVINNITYGDDTISGVVNASMNGTVYITIPGSEPIAADVNESGEFNIPLKLPAGEYTVDVDFVSADGNYNGDTIVNFTINTTKPQVNVDIGSDKSFEIKFGDNVVAIVTVPVDATGNVSFSLDNETWTIIPIPEGESSVEFDIPGLNAGDYILFVKYNGDNNYDPVYSENPFTVDQSNTIITVDPVNGKAGEKVKITVRVNDENGNPVNEGTVIVKFNGKEYEVDVVNGIATIEVVLPKSGTYTTIAYYEGLNYNSSYTTFTVEVSDIPSPNPNPNPVNNGVGNMENTGNPILVLLIALCAIGLESFRRKL